jgi:hypothetical protein
MGGEQQPVLGGVDHCVMVHSLQEAAQHRPGAPGRHGAPLPAHPLRPSYEPTSSTLEGRLARRGTSRRCQVGTLFEREPVDREVALLLALLPLLLSDPLGGASDAGHAAGLPTAPKGGAPEPLAPTGIPGAMGPAGRRGSPPRQKGGGAA